jgi:hypothetical protein
VSNGIYTDSSHIVKHLVDRDNYAAGLAPELLVNNIKIRMNYSKGPLVYAERGHDSPEWDVELTEALSVLLAVKNASQRLQLELRFAPRHKPTIRQGLSGTLAILLGLPIASYPFSCV